MKKLTLLVAVVAVVLLTITCKNEPATAPAIAEDEIAEEEEEEVDKQYLYASDLYKGNCVSCHETSVPKFINRDWQHGNSWNEVNRSIRYGHIFMDDIEFVKFFPDSAYNKLTDYILVSLEQQTIESFAIDPDYSGTVSSEQLNFRLDTIVKGLEIPWGIDFLPNGDLLVTDRNGNFYRQKEGAEKVKIKGTPRVHYEGQGGLLDVKVHPDFEQNQTIYISYAKPNGTKKEATTAVMMAKLINDELVQQKNIMIALPYTSKKYHYGSRFAFDQEGHLYVTVGDRANRDDNPQDLSKYAGKIHRFNADGSIPSDNPFVNTKGAIPSIWSYGHRNPQGLVFDKASGIMWETEHAPRGGDEINIIEKGLNYGWRDISYGINYNGTTFTNTTHKDGMEQPIFYYMPSTGTCGLTKVTSDKYPAWKGDLLAGSLRFRYISRLKMEGQQVMGEERLLENIGRLRDIKMGRDGYIYCSVENPGLVFRLMPELVTSH